MVKTWRYISINFTRTPDILEVNSYFLLMTINNYDKTTLKKRISFTESSGELFRSPCLFFIYKSQLLDYCCKVVKTEKSFEPRKQNRICRHVFTPRSFCQMPLTHILVEFLLYSTTFFVCFILTPKQLHFLLSCWLNCGEVISMFFSEIFVLISPLCTFIHTESYSDYADFFLFSQN